MGESGRHYRVCKPALTLACLALFAGPGWSQVAPPPKPSTPSVLPASPQAPRATVPADPRALPATLPRELAKPEDELLLRVQRYEVAPSAPPELKAALAQLTAPYVGDQCQRQRLAAGAATDTIEADAAGKCSYEDLVNATAEVTRFLQRELGYYLGYAYLPEQTAQDLQNGVVRIEILEGRLDSVTIQGPWTLCSDPLPAPAPVARGPGSKGAPKPKCMDVRKDVVQAYLDRLKPGEILRVRDVERVVFLVNDLRGMSAKFEVAEGDTPGTAKLVVSATPDNRWSGKAEVDANGSPYLGQVRGGALVSANSLLGRGDALTANVLASQGLQFALLSLNLPVGADGVKLGSTVSYVHYKLDTTQFPLGVNGDALTLSAYALYPWIRSRNLNLFTLASVDNKRYADRLDAGGTQTDKSARVFTLGLTGDLRDNLFNGAVSTFEANLVHGQVRYADGPPGGLDDSPNLSKITLSVNRLQNLVEGKLLAYAALRVQQALANLDTSEQFRLGGSDGVRAFAPGEGTGDSGTVFTAELRYLPPESLVGRLARETVVSLFYDDGRVTFRHDRRQRPATFVNSASYAGAGVAVSWERAGEYAARVSLAAPVRGTAKSDKPRSLRLFAQLTKLF